MDIEQLKVQLDEYGFVIIHNLIPTNQANHMTERLMDIMNQHSDVNDLNQNLRGVFNYDDQDTFIPLVTNPVYLELAAHMLGPDFQMAEVGARWIKPGAEAQGLHADVPVGWFPQSGLPIPDACFMVNCIWMLTDFTLENGATQLMPFSHHSRRLPRRGVEYEHLVTAEGPAGSIVIFHGAIWHRGGANVTSDKRRMGVSSGFHASWMDPAAGGWYLMKRSVRDRMPTQVQRMNRHVVEG
ncbi:MAG: phytanoyl-CoA dioxygenase family protein [Candidatus Poribacteria bacterium]|nr:phytanoyl-CoA dioxygenase family protein [Candidatus Poribacteria bacterium]